MANDRTALMRLFAQDKKWAIRRNQKDQEYLHLADQKDLLVLTRDVDNFCQPIASIGGGLEREIIVLDPGSKLLLTKYDELKTLIGKEKDPHTILNLAVKFTKECLSPNDEKHRNNLEKHVDDFCNSFKGKNDYKESPIILLDEFIKSKMGVCRHHGLFLCFLLNKLIKDKVLPEARVYHHRNFIVPNEGTKQEGKPGAHVWVMLAFIDPEKLYHLDSLWYSEAYEVKGNAANNAILNRYGKKAALDCQERYQTNLKKEFCLLDEKQQNEFINTLLEKAITDIKTCKKILNEQSSASRILIKNKLSDNRKKETGNKNEKNYSNLFSILSLINETNNLHKAPYTKYSFGSEQREQFIIGLLLMTSLQRLDILENQSLTDLQEIQISLQNKISMPYFIKFSKYYDLRQKVIGAIKQKKNLAKAAGALSKDDKIALPPATPPQPNKHYVNQVKQPQSKNKILDQRYVDIKEEKTKEEFIASLLKLDEGQMYIKLCNQNPGSLNSLHEDMKKIKTPSNQIQCDKVIEYIEVIRKIPIIQNNQPGLFAPAPNQPPTKSEDKKEDKRVDEILHPFKRFLGIEIIKNFMQDEYKALTSSLGFVLQNSEYEIISFIKKTLDTKDFSKRLDDFLNKNQNMKIDPSLRKDILKAIEEINQSLTNLETQLKPKGASQNKHAS